MTTKTKVNSRGCALVKLPDKPSDLILLALKDLALVERSKIYDIDMGEWHRSYEDEEMGATCAVCFAGAVMARTFKAPMTRSLFPDQMPFRRHNAKRLCALDQFRQGLIQGGIFGINREFSKIYLLAKHDSLHDEVEALSDSLDYCKDPVLFKRNMRKIAKRIAKMGI